MRQSTCILASISYLTLLVPLAQAASAPAQYVTPAEVVSAYISASRAGDVDTTLDCLSPDGIDKMTHLIVGMMAYNTPTSAPTPTDPNKEKAAFEAKYGLEHRQRLPDETRQQFTDRLVRQIKDKRGFLAELMSKDAAAVKKAPPTTRPVPELNDLVIAPDGNSATAKLVKHSGPQTTSTDVKFKKIDGSWKIDGVLFF